MHRLSGHFLLELCLSDCYLLVFVFCPVLPNEMRLQYFCIQYWDNEVFLYSYTDDIILLNFIFTGLYGYEITPGFKTNKQRHHLLLLKTGIHVAPTHL